MALRAKITKQKYLLIYRFKTKLSSVNFGFCSIVVGMKIFDLALLTALKSKLVRKLLST